MNTTKRADQSDPLYGWVMVFVVFMLSGLSFGAMGAISVFLKPLSAEFGWDRGATSLGYTAIAFSSALFGIVWGHIADRVGSRWFGLIAAITMSGSLYMLSSQTSLLHFYLFYFIFGAFGNALAYAPLFANVGFWFHRNPGLALGITASGGAIGQGIVPYLAGIAIAEHGWRWAYEAMALGYLIIALPIALLVRESPHREKARTSTVVEERRYALSEKEVITWLSIAVIFCCNCMAVPIVHTVPMLTDSGHSLELATRVLLVLMLAGGAGRILAGKLCDVIGALPTYILMSAGQTVSVFAFPHLDGQVALYALAVFFGFTYSGVMSSILVCVRMMVSARYAARGMSITTFFGWLGMGLGGFFGGYFFDIHGAYQWSFAFASAMGMINIAILLAFYSRFKRQEALQALAT
ncbi:MAG: MFS transporter [Pseudomonadota bacterium]